MTEQAGKQNAKQQPALIHRLVQAVDQDPANYQPYYNLLVALTAGEAFDQAEELAQKALTKFADNQQAHDTLTYGLGNVYYQAGHYDLAIKQYQQILTSQLKADAYLMVAQSLMAKHDFQHALVYALTAQDNRPTDMDTQLLVADILLALGNNQQASNAFLKARTQEPTNGHANFGAGLTAMVLGKPYATYFATAKSNDPDYYAKHQEQLVAIEQLVKNGGPDSSQPN